jgi:hypothetical protein
MGGGFYFTLGRHCIDYQYDPGMYFPEEEICLALRSYTMGYDIFHPHRSVVWHYYDLQRCKKHSQDHSTEAKTSGIVGSSWIELMKIGKKRLLQLYGARDYGLDLGIYALGNKRTISDYEKYAGVKFKEQLLHIDAIRGTEPPCKNYNETKGFFRTATFDLDYDASGLQLLSKRTTRIWVGLADFDRNIVWRKKLSARQIRNVINSQRVQASVTIKPKIKISSWFVLARDETKWNEPIIIPMKQINGRGVSYENADNAVFFCSPPFSYLS